MYRECNYIKQIGIALDKYKTDIGLYPTTDQGLDALCEKNYVDSTRFLDPWGNKYLYESADGSEYTLHSAGPDGIDKTKDDI